MKMAGTWVKRGSTIELLDGDPLTRSTREFGEVEQFVPPGPYLPPRPSPVQPRLTQKALYLEQLRKRTGHAHVGSTATAFEFNNPGWQNRIQLEALVEFYMNFTDPWLSSPWPSRPHIIPGVNVPRHPPRTPPLPRKPGSDYITVDPSTGYITLDLSKGWHLIVVDSFGGRLTGYAATAAGNIVTLDRLPNPSKVNRNFDTIYLPNDTARASKTYRITDVHDVRRTVTLDGNPTFKESRWHIPAGVSGQLPPPDPDLGPGGDRGFDHYDGAMFIVKDGVVHGSARGPFRWTSYTSRDHPEGHEWLSSLRGNKHYEFSSFRSPESASRNYCFKVNDIDARYDGVREARFYFSTPVKPDVAPVNPEKDNRGKTRVRIHRGAAVNPKGGCGSAGCIVASDFYAFRDKMIDLFQKDYAAEKRGERDVEMDKLYKVGHEASKMIWTRTERKDDSGTTVKADKWNNRIKGTFWLVRPDERPLPVPFVSP